MEDRYLTMVCTRCSMYFFNVVTIEAYIVLLVSVMLVNLLNLIYMWINWWFTILKVKQIINKITQNEAK